MVEYAQVPSPNYSDRVIVPRFIVVHYTASSSASSAINWLSNPVSKVSAHIVIARTGNCTQMVPFNKRAWHAGPSAHSGWTGLNSHSIGIELVNTGDQEYPEAQLLALEEVIEELRDEFPTIFQVVGHSEIDTEVDPALKKRDPGDHFPMDRYRINAEEKLYEVTASKNLNVRKRAAAKSKIVDKFPKDTQFIATSSSGAWVGVEDGGFVHRDYVRRLA